MFLWPKNPLTMRGTITQCWLFTYQTTIADAQALLPPQLEAVTHRDCAFWNVVVCHIASMRPRSLPAFTGLGYHHVAYRLYARFHPISGPPIEGLYFLRSDCDNRLISLAGSLVTDFNFHTAPVLIEQEEQTVNINVQSKDAPARAKLRLDVTPQLAPYSAFDSPGEASAFLKYKPFGISVDATGQANIVKIVRREKEWKSRLVTVESEHWSFFDEKTVRPEICYQVQPIKYQWNRGGVMHSAR